jgi:hypothetical protein
MVTRSIVAFASVLFSVSAAQAGSQLFEASWTVKALGNECSIAASGASSGPYCGDGASESEFYSAIGIPLGIQCDPNQPHCPFDSTPTDGSGNFAPRGGYWAGQAYCAPWSNWQSLGTTARPAKGATSRTSGAWERPIPPLYRNPAFFTSGGEPHTTSCNALSTGATPGGKGLAQAGDPITGRWAAITTGTGRGGFYFAAAPKHHAAGVRVGQGDVGYSRWGRTKSQGSARSGAIGEFGGNYPYIYSYTYATLRNDAGIFGPGQGPGSFSISFKRGFNTVAKAVVKQGAAKFGGTMRMLGQLTSKGCYYRNGGCSNYSWNWRYDAIGAAAYTSGGVVTMGHWATWCLDTGWGPFGPCPSIENPTGLSVYGARFPWTTGSVTVTASGFYSLHKTVHYAKGYDNRTLTSGEGTIQLVTPVVTRRTASAGSWDYSWYTGGIGVLRIKFVPEPRAWWMLIAGISFLGVLYRRAS